MSRQRVSEITPILATSSSTPVDISRTTSITSDPDGRLVATRQSAITAGLEQRRGDRGVQHGGDPKRFSGESERIGKWAWNSNTPFGQRFGYL